jgi:hypothetical protein
VRSLQAPAPDRDTDPPELSELQSAEARLATTHSRRDSLPWWRRREREELDRQVAAQTRAVEYWRRVAPQSAGVESREVRHLNPKTGTELLQLQAADRVALLELLEQPDVSGTVPEMVDADVGMEL